MPDMYDKLGDLLNEALESGSILEQKSAKTDFNLQDRDTSDKNRDKSGLFYLKKEKITSKKEEIATGQVVKMYKYAKNIQFPPEIQNALTTLDIVYLNNFQQIKKQYRKLLKIYHPDSKNTIQNTQNVHFYKQYTIDDIKSAYNLLSTYFNIK